jgi:hypothetical protein
MTLLKPHEMAGALYVGPEHCTLGIISVQFKHSNCDLPVEAYNVKIHLYPTHLVDELAECNNKAVINMFHLQ